MNRNDFTPLTVFVRIVVYALLVFGMAEAIRFDAMYPMEQGYFGEISRTEISQEIILFILSFFFLFLGYRYRPVQPVANLVALFLLISFIREFNFLIDWWEYPAYLVLGAFFWLLFRDYKKLTGATREFFSRPASAWFLSGVLVTYVFSRLMGRSSFWLLMYDETNYRMAKAATEEGLELLGNGLMLISAVEFLLLFWSKSDK
jgi:hypothetical protein